MVIEEHAAECDLEKKKNRGPKDCKKFLEARNPDFNVESPDRSNYLG